MSGPAFDLSVCIPTYNRAAMLRRSLTALAEQVRREKLADRVQVCVADNASPDDTPAVLAELTGRFPELAWKVWRNPANLGAVGNICRVAAAGDGEWLAITGDDDEICPDGLATMLDAGREPADVLLFRSAVGPPGQWVRSLPADDGTRRWFRRTADLNAALGLFHASFLGNLAFRRAAYHRHFRPEYADNAYPHTHVAAAVLAGGGSALFVNRAVYAVDDSSRTWRRLQPRYTCLDMARVQTAAAPPGTAWADLSAAYTPLVWSVPRAVLGWRTADAPPVRLGELLASYRRSVVHQAAAVGLWGVARALPRPVLRRLLAGGSRREGT